MSEINKKVILEIAEKEGFCLEEKVDRIFSDMSLTTERNVELAYGGDIDVLAYPTPGHYNADAIFVMQCKGSPVNMGLLLFCNTNKMIREEPNTLPDKPMPHRKLKKLVCERGKSLSCVRPDSANEKIMILSTTEDYPIAFRHAYQGDFYKVSSQNKKLPKEKNLYKGIKQLTEGIASLQQQGKFEEILRNFSSEQVKVIPVLVTNRQISIKEDDIDDVVEVNWAVYAVNPDIGFVCIVNIDSLKEFIEKFG